MRFLVTWLATLLAVLVISLIGKDQIISFGTEDWIRTAAIFSLVLGLLNAIVRPILKVLTLPLTVMTLGLFSLVINLLMFWLASRLVDGVTVPNGLLGLIIASVLVSIVSGLIGRVLDKK
jgi:putative membrane protein